MLRLAAAFVLFAAPASAEVTRADCIFLIRNGADMVSAMIQTAPLRISTLSQDPDAAEVTALASNAGAALSEYLEAVATYCTAKFPS